MNGRGGAGGYFLLLFLSIIIFLQIYSMKRAERFYEQLNRLEKVFRGAASEDLKPKYKAAEGQGEEYPGDEGDWLVWAFRVEPKTLNPISVDTDAYAIWITIPYIFEPLLTYDYDQVKLKPALAESYEMSNDGLEITFHLRDDIHFSDGAAVTADDVVFTYQTIVNPKIDAANVANQYIDVDGVVKVNDRTVKFLMKRPHFKSLENLSFTWSMGVLPKHIYGFSNPEDFNKHRSNPVGSGPYVFEKWDVGREIVLRRNENYWGEKPKLEKIVYKFIPNPVASIQALRSHQVDIVIPEAEQFADIVKDEQFKKEFNCLSYWTPWTPFYYIGWNQDTPFFSDRQVRLAMTHIINREQIISQLLKGISRTITGPFYINGRQNDPNIKPWPYSLEKARRLLDEAGWRDTDGDGLRDKDGVPFRFKFMYSNSYALYERLAKLLKDEAAKVGIEVMAEPTEWSILVGRLNDRKFDSAVAGWGGDILEDPYQLWHSSQIGNRGSNYVGFNNKEADSIIEQARRTLDETRRNELYHKLHRILHEEQPYTFLFTQPTLRLVDKRFKNVVIHKLGPKYWQWYVPKGEQRYK
jgi:peptide/nickel transport system substrate-binding protein